MDERVCAASGRGLARASLPLLALLPVAGAAAGQRAHLVRMGASAVLDAEALQPLRPHGERGLLGSSSAGEVLFAATPGPLVPSMDQAPGPLGPGWRMCVIPPASRSVAPVRDAPLCPLAVSRRAPAIWVAAAEGLSRVANDRATRAGQALWVGQGAVDLGVLVSADTPALGATGPLPVLELTVDRSGLIWSLADGSVACFADEPAALVATGFGIGPASAALGVHPRERVWLYTAAGPPDQPAQLRRLRAEGSGVGFRIAEADSLPDLPRLAEARIVPTLDGRLILAGQTLAGDLLVEVVSGVVRSQAIPPALTHGRRVTAVDVDQEGCVYLATDGAGVLTYREGEWGVHPITEHLPVLEGSDLKPVDDILVTDDGTLHAACQFQVVIWKPD